MRIRLPGIGLIVMMALVAESVNSAPAQGEMPPGSTSVNVQSAPGENVARIHWIGTDQLSRDTNASHLVSFWNIPEGAKLQAQIYDKLSAAPWNLFHRPLDTNAAALLRPLVQDVVRHECYLQVRQAPNQPAQFAFAIRLDERRATLWQSYMAAVAESLTGIRPVNAGGATGGWSLQKHHSPNLIELSRVGEWTVLGAATGQNTLVAELVSRIRRDHVPFGPEVSNDWFQASVDLPRFAAALSTNWNLGGDWPRINLLISGEGTNVLTRGEFAFHKLLPVELDQWNFPASIMSGPFDSFTAVRGFNAWLGSRQAWNELHIGAPPNQLCLWTLMGRGWNSYGAAPLTDASNAVYKLTDLVLQKEGTWFGTNDQARFTRSDTYNGLQWRGNPWLWPSVQSLTLTNGNFVFGGLFLNQPTDPPPAGYFDPVLSDTNLLYYDLEQTGPRLPQWLYVGQFARYVSGIPQMPFKAASLEWLRVAGPRMGPSVTRITKTSDTTLSLDRVSSVGFTAIEMHFLADWLESPQFPIGLHTFLAPPDK
jgi:hypothetical protein